MLACLFVKSKEVLLSLSNGLLVVVDTVSLKVVQVFGMEHPVNDHLFLADTWLLMVAGPYPQVSFVDMRTEQTVSKIALSGVPLVQIMDDSLFCYTHNAITKWNYKTQELVNELAVKYEVLKLKATASGLLVYQASG